ncbi:MAG TPA: hypothetical protein VHZ95_05280, partial [Polyangiales bacterium]|nr:hypothetical protein [Polyangiales bacterium]
VAVALSQLTAAKPELSPEARAVFVLVREEIRDRTLEPLALQHAFALLSLALPRDALALARRALVSNDQRQRGTALEYLQNVLPEPLRGEWMHWIEAREPSAKMGTSPNLETL